jgi:hypothetical protein
MIEDSPHASLTLRTAGTLARCVQRHRTLLALLLVLDVLLWSFTVGDHAPTPVNPAQAPKAAKQRKQCVDGPLLVFPTPTVKDDGAHL